MSEKGYNSFYTGRQIDSILSQVEKVMAGANEKITLASLQEQIDQNKIAIEQITPELDKKVSKTGDIIQGTLYITDELIVPLINSTGANSLYKQVTINNSDEFQAHIQAGRYLYKVEEGEYKKPKVTYVKVEAYNPRIPAYYIAEESAVDSLQVDTLNVGVNFGTGTMTKIKGDKVHGAIWNDYAEFRQSDENEAGRVVCEKGDGTLSRSTKRLQPAAEIVSDTFGFAIGRTKICKTPIAVAGRVLAYPNEDISKYKIGDCVCAGPNGTVSKMSRLEIIFYPDRIIGTVSEIPNYETWGVNEAPVNGRIWIKIK